MTKSKCRKETLKIKAAKYIDFFKNPNQIHLDSNLTNKTRD